MTGGWLPLNTPRSALLPERSEDCCVLITGAYSGGCVQLGSDLDNKVVSMGPDPGQTCFVFEYVQDMWSVWSLAQIPSVVRTADWPIPDPEGGAIRFPGVSDFSQNWIDSDDFPFELTISPIDYGQNEVPIEYLEQLLAQITCRVDLAQPLDFCGAGIPVIAHIGPPPSFCGEPATHECSVEGGCASTTSQSKWVPNSLLISNLPSPQPQLHLSTLAPLRVTPRPEAGACKAAHQVDLLPPVLPLQKKNTASTSAGREFLWSSACIIIAAALLLSTRVQSCADSCCRP
ncbi:hypothetical protein DFH09DRAFT_1095604 [Mycena vulgaris]|nr:hypothetical protein DFH09DRAFT_1095604 [Mycena vulgaris]